MASPVSQLADLLADVFNDPEMRTFFREQGVGDTIPGPGVALSYLAYEGADALRRRGLIDVALFVTLAHMHPHQTPRIRQVASACGFSVQIADPAPRVAEPAAPAQVTAPPTAAAPSKITVLLLLSAPATAEHGVHNISGEAKAVQEMIQASAGRDRIEVEIELAPQPDELPALLKKHRPHIVHFSAHGTNAALILSGAGNWSGAGLRGGLLAKLFARWPGNTRCVIFNACNSEPIATAVAQHIDVCIGYDNPVSIKAAVTFSKRLYQAIGEGDSLQDAFDAAAWAAESVDDAAENTLVLAHRPGVDPAQIKLL